MANMKAYNIDETGFNTEYSPRKIICNKNRKSQVVECNLSNHGSPSLLLATLLENYDLPCVQGKTWNQD